MSHHHHALQIRKCTRQKNKVGKILYFGNFFNKTVFPHALIKYVMILANGARYLSSHIQHALGYSWDKSGHSDWFFLDQDFAIQTIYTERVISHVFFFAKAGKFKINKFGPSAIKYATHLASVLEPYREIFPSTDLTLGYSRS